MKKLAILIALGLAACGADGEPEPRQSNVAITGDARIGVRGSL